MQLRLSLDGEHIPQQDLTRIFCRPPRVPKEFSRSSLIVGSRGAGKTTLLRVLQVRHPGIAAIIDVPTALNSLSKETAFGPLAFAIPRGIERLLIGKAKSLSALAVAISVPTSRLRWDLKALGGCLPISFRERKLSGDSEFLLDLMARLIRAPLSDFEAVANLPGLRTFIESLGNQAQARSQPLLLMFDRADMVPTPCLVPILELLDQSPHFVALVAMRPSHSGPAISEFSRRVIANDHYGVHHLGTHPRSTEWKEFVAAAVRAQLHEDYDKIPADTRASVIALCRDSIRASLELFASFCGSRAHRRQAALLEAIRDQQSSALSIAQQTLRLYHSSSRELLVRLRSEARARAGGKLCRVVLQVERGPKEDIFDPIKKWDFFADTALRNGIFFMPEGDVWMPGSQIDRVELAPTIMWQKEDKLAFPRDLPHQTLFKREGELFGIPRKPPQAPSIFLAFRMDVPESRKFREDLSRLLAHHHRLASFLVRDGHTPGGTNWPREVRNRIKKAKLVVGDVTAMKPDVMFELGFAVQLQKPIIPVTDTKENRVKLPTWLTQIQMETYADDPEIQAILSSIEDHLFSQRLERTMFARQPVSDLAVWLKRTDWNAHECDQFETVIERENLRAETLSNIAFTDEQRIERAISAWLLVASLDGTREDSLVHFICGAIVARPKLWRDSDHKRTIIIVEESDNSKGSFVADSLKRCEQVQVLPLSKVREAILVAARARNQAFVRMTTGRRAES